MGKKIERLSSLSVGDQLTIVGIFITIAALYAGNMAAAILMIVITTILTIDLYFRRTNKTFYDNYMLIENAIELDGSATFNRTVEVEVINGKLYSEDYKISLSGETLLKEYKRIVKTIEGKSDIIISSITEDNKNTIYILNFSPPLDSKNNSKIKFRIEETLAKGPFLMTKDEILNCIKNGNWLFSEPYAFTRYLIQRHTKKLILIVNFPENYKIHTLDSFWDVVSGSSNHRDDIEYLRLDTNNCFTKFVNLNRTYLKLEVNEPKIGLSYIIKWIPPNKEEYNLLLNMLPH